MKNNKLIQRSMATPRTLIRMSDLNVKKRN